LLTNITFNTFKHHCTRSHVCGIGKLYPNSMCRGSFLPVIPVCPGAWCEVEVSSRVCSRYGRRWAVETSWWGN